MQTKKIYITVVLLFLSISAITVVFLMAFKLNPQMTTVSAAANPHNDSVKGCVFKTVFGEESSDSNFIYKTPAKVQASMEEGLDWMAKAQLPDGGWGSGTHSHQEIRNPHAVKSDPASTALVSMALLRCNNTPYSGKYSAHLNKAINYLLAAVEHSDNDDALITSQTGTQPQMKLGSNIDVILTSQFLTNLLDEVSNDAALLARVKKANDKCVIKIQKVIATDGSFKGSGWAGVLQSALATNALETAQGNGVSVDTALLERAKDFQKGNYNAESGDVKTDMGAGIMLYSVSGSSRASAKEAKVAKEKIDAAKTEGTLSKDDEVSEETLKKTGLSATEAKKYSDAYKINEASKVRAQQNDVMDGFGSNGGEEFLSYLQTGEGLIVSRDTAWTKWYDNITGRLLTIQNNDGSWNGHHCITSPVFCTATCLLILSVNNDIESLIRL